MATELVSETMVAEPVQDRAIRQRDLVPPLALATYHAVVIGVGAVGRQVALQLAAMGVPQLTLIDHDVVGVENLAVQGYRHDDLGTLKVDATAVLARELHPACVVHAIPDRFRRSSPESIPSLGLSRASGDHQAQGGGTRPLKLAVFACVDSMSGRRIVWETLRSRAAFHSDGRMAGEVVRVLASADPANDERYPLTLFDDGSAHPAPCTGRSTLYAASLAAALMVSRFAMHLRGIVPPRDALLNLLAGELVTTD